MAQDHPGIAIKDEEEESQSDTGQVSTPNRLAGRVVIVGDHGQDVANVRVIGYLLDPGNRRWLGAITDTEGRFAGRPVTEPVILAAFNGDHSLGTIQRIEVGQNKPVLALAPTVSVFGTLKDEESDKLAVNRRLKITVRPKRNDSDLETFFLNRFAQEGTTDESGHFRVIGLVTGFAYNVWADRAEDGNGSALAYQIDQLKPTSAEEVDLGELHIPKPYRPPTFDAYVDSNYLQKPPEERLARGLKLTDLGSVRLLVIVAEPDSDAAQQFFRFRYNNAYNSNARLHEETHRLLLNFIPLSLAPSSSEQFLTDHGISVPAANDATFAVLKSDGSIVAQTTFRDLTGDGQFAPELLAGFLSLYQHPPLPNARGLFDDALAEALNENKRVLVQVGGPACGACYLLSQYLDEHMELIAKDYVHLKLDTRMPGFEALYRELSGDEPKGVPWMTILDSEGRTLITGDTEEGNIGYPSNQEGIAHFKHMLIATKQRLTDDEIATLLSPLEKAFQEQ